MLIFLSSNISAQTSFLNQDGKVLKKQNNVWYFYKNGKPTFRVDTTVVTIKIANIEAIDAIKNIAAKYGMEVLRYNRLGYVDIKVTNDKSFVKTLNNFKKNFSEYQIEINSLGESFIAPNDPGFPYQYYLQYSSSFPNIGVDRIWDYEDGSTNPQTVAVIDEGVDSSVSDLYNASNNWDYVEGDNDPMPSNNGGDYIEEHGTGVAGIIAAKTNNNHGISGIAGGWGNPGAKIMSLRVGSGTNPPNSGWITVIKSSAVDDAIIFAADHGASIINMSFGVEQNSAIDNAINYAYYKKNCVLVAATGNSDKKPIAYPASHSKVIAVAGIKKDWSHYGSYIGGPDIVAPAEGIYTLFTHYSGPVEWGFGGGGTSFSAPQVAGIAALLWSNNPSLTNLDIKNLLLQTANNLGNSLYFGNGLVRADYAMLKFDLDNGVPLPETPTNVSIYAPVGGNPTIYWDNVAGASKYYIFRSNSYAGRYGFEKVATVSSGNTSWMDNSVIVQIPRFALSIYYYRVAAVDDYDNISILSNEVSCGVNSINKNNIGEKDLDVIYEDKLLGNYPNPFNPSTVIEFSLSKRSDITLKVFDVTGREVKTLANGVYSQGKHKITFDGSNKLASGFYFYSLRIASKIFTGKMLLMK